MVKEAAVALGLNPDLYDAVSLRIAGATDLRDALGYEAGADIIQKRGRWWTDIHHIYERTTAAEMLEASVAMGNASRPELEAVLDGYAQPARGVR
jgi:hypothetical protein